jgi:hypothetical protein
MDNVNDKDGFLTISSPEQAENMNKVKPIPDWTSPEICLEAVCKDPALAVHVPAFVSGCSEMNIYRFAMAVRKLAPELGFHQVRDLYEGKNVEIGYTIPGTAIPRKVHLRHNRLSNSLEYCDIPQGLSAKRQEAGRKNKGGKLKV